MAKLSFLKNYKKILTLHVYKGLLKSDVLYNNIFPQFSQLTPQMALSMFEPSVSVPVRSCVFFLWYFEFWKISLQTHFKLLYRNEEMN